MLNNRQSNRRRGRGRGPQGNGGRQDNGSRIDNRARGNAPQMLEKYKNLAREAQLQGDRVLTEYYLQFSDHYFRIVAENRARFEENRPPRRDEWQNDDGLDSELSDESFASEPESSDEGAAPYSTGQDRDRRQPNRGGSRDGGRHRERADRDAPVAAAGIDVSILPPALGVSADPIADLDGDAAPVRRRGRPRRAEASNSELEASE